MPPKPNDCLLFSLSPERFDNDMCRITGADSLSSFPTHFVKHGNSFIDIRRSQLVNAASNDTSDQECHARFAASLQNILARVENLLLQLVEAEQLEGNNSPISSPVRDACRHSLSTTMPIILSKVSLLVDSIEVDSADSSKRMIGRLRATFAIFNAVQYLDTIESAMTSHSRMRFDEAMASVLERIHNTSSIGEHFKANAIFRVSHWIAPTLAFDIKAGEVVSTSIEQGNSGPDSLPMTLQVEPVMSFSGEDLVTGKKGDRSFKRCKVVIEKCHHKSKEFAEGAGTIGLAVVGIKVMPLDEETHKTRIWGEKETERLCVTDARVVQHNAFPPKPRSHVDLYTSSLYGDPSASTRLDIQTYVTENGEAPQLCIELYVASCEP